MPTAVQPSNSTTVTNHVVKVTSSVGLLIGLVAIIVFAIWLSHRRHLPVTAPGFMTDYRTEPDHRRKDIGRYTLELIPVVVYTSELRGMEKKPRTMAHNSVSSNDLPRGEAGQAIKEANPLDSSKGTEPLLCSVCTDDLITGEKVRILPCEHIYHQNCIDPWLLGITGTCPMW